MKTHNIVGGGELTLHVREWGPTDGPAILLIHGWSQSHLCWSKQYESALAERYRLVALDLRGHGTSDAPRDPECYTQPQLWADDIAATIDQLALERPVLVGWSYGGFVICDYVRAYGQDAISGVNFVAAGVTLAPSAFGTPSALGTLIGPGFLDHVEGATVSDLSRNIDAMRAFVKACVVSPIPRDDLERMLCWNMVVPTPVRAGLLARQIDSDDVLSSLRVPVLMTQGRADTVLLPAMGEHILQTCETADASWYDGVGHVPFLEAADRFNEELAQLTGRAAGTTRARSASVA